jgi:hypothetical protein
LPVFNSNFYTIALAPAIIGVLVMKFEKASAYQF